MGRGLPFTIGIDVPLYHNHYCYGVTYDLPVLI